MSHSLEEILPEARRWLPWPFRRAVAGKGSCVSWAERPGRRALVFVHGFLGSSIKTWRNFPRLLRREPKLAGWDLVFFGYESARRQAAKSGEDFYRFLGRFATAPGSFMHLTRSARGDRPRAGTAPYYDEICVAAHSLGAMVVRHALLLAADAAAPWGPRVRLVLYAPAHAGAKDVHALANAIPTFGGARLFVHLKLRDWPVLDDLTRKTDFVKQLRDRTEERLAQGGHDHLVATRIVDAEFEDVVDQVQLISQDPWGEMIDGTSHSSVCKPRAPLLEPYYRLVDPL